MRHRRQPTVHGPLATFADGFREELERRGYTPKSWGRKVREMDQLSRWLDGNGLTVDNIDIDAVWVQGFLEDLGRSWKQPPTVRAMRPLMAWLRHIGAIRAEPPAPAPHQPLDELIDRYRCWMEKRGLAARTVGRYEQSARRFLGWRVSEGGRAYRGRRPRR